MEHYFLDKIEELKNDWGELANELVDLIENNTMGMNKREIDEALEKLHKIEKDMKNIELKIPENMRKNYFLESIDYLKDKERKLKNKHQDHSDNNMMEMNSEVIRFLENLIRENKRDQNRIENQMSNIINNSNSNSNKQNLHVNISPNISPTFEQSQSQTMNIEIKGLINDFEAELSKSNPDINKVKSLGEKIIKKVPTYLPFINMILNLLGRCRW